MILPDNTPLSPRKLPAGSTSNPVPVEEHHVLPPPAYSVPSHNPTVHVAPPQYYRDQDDVEAHASGVHAPLVHPTVSAHHVEQVQSKQPHSRKRLLKAFGMAVVLFLVIGSFSRTVFILAHRRNRPQRLSEETEDHGPASAISLIPFPKASDGRVEECISLSGFASADTDGSGAHPVATFYLPLTTNVLYVFGRGQLARGSLTLVSTNDPMIPEGQIRVDVTPKYTSHLALEQPNICLLDRALGEMSIGILTPTAWHWNDGISFTINIRLPVPNHLALHVKTFQEDLKLFSHPPWQAYHGATSGPFNTWPSWRFGDLRSSSRSSSLDYITKSDYASPMTGGYTQPTSTLASSTSYPTSWS